jgi:hypothetical protein
MYDPLVGRFTSWDPVEGGDRNAYLYAGADPCNKYDLDGRANIAIDPHGYLGSGGGDSTVKRPKACVQAARVVAGYLGLFNQSDLPTKNPKFYFSRAMRLAEFLRAVEKKGAILRFIRKGVNLPVTIAATFFNWS